MYILDRFIPPKKPSYWTKIIIAAVKKAEICKNDSNNINNITTDLINDYKDKGYLAETFRKLLDLPDLAVILFFCYLYNEKALEGNRPSSIAETNPDCNWFLNADSCFFNVRATGKNVSETGNLIDAIKLLAALRVKSIHLAPFFECHYGIIYCQNSFYTINSEIVNMNYLKYGVSSKEQVKFFIDCIHLLGFAVGFDFTPHTCKMSKLCFDRPDLFRWIRTNKNATSLYNEMDINEQYSDTFQIACHKEVSGIANEVKNIFHIKNLEIISDSEISISNMAQASIKQRLLEDGYYPVPPHTWNGIGVPGFAEYKYTQEWPVWRYLDKDGNDVSKEAIGLHTSLYFHKNLTANAIPENVNDIAVNETTINFIKSYLKEIVSYYLFDFIRVDYVDHIFDNVEYRDGKQIPVCETLTPNELLDIINYLKKDLSGLGFQADHMKLDTKLFEQAGFNLILGAEACNSFTRQIISESLERSKSAVTAKQSNCKALYTIDTHDVAHPLFLGKELAEREGKQGFIARLFLARFANVGKNRRPVYEVVGNQDFSTGIHKANIKPQSLFWRSDMGVFYAYHLIEDIYAGLKDKLDTSFIKSFEVSEHSAVWVLEDSQSNTNWICVSPLIQYGECKEEYSTESFTFPLSKEISNYNFWIEYDSLKTYTNTSFCDNLVIDKTDNKICVQVKSLVFALIEL